MSFGEEILEYFLDKHELENGSFAYGPHYYQFHLNGELSGTQLVLALADKGYVVSLVKGDQSVSTLIQQHSDNLKSQLDSFVRSFHTETAVHHRKLSFPSSDKVPSNVRETTLGVAPSATTPSPASGSGSGSALRSLASSAPAPGSAPVFEDEHQLLGAPHGQPQIDIGARDLDPFGKYPSMRPALTDPFGNPVPSAQLPSQGGMHPTPFGSNIRYDPPGPGQNGPSFF